jgi:hypothetical protein
LSRALDLGSEVVFVPIGRNAQAEHPTNPYLEVSARLTSGSPSQLFFALLIYLHVHLHVLFTLCILLFIFVSSWSFTRVSPAVQGGKLLSVYKFLMLLQTRGNDLFSLDFG